MANKPSDTSLLIEAVLFFILAKVIYEVLGVWFAALQGDYRAALAFFVTFILYDKVGKKILRKVF